MTAAPYIGAWLRDQREQRRWTRLEMARRIIKAARRHGDTTMPSAANLTHNLYRWERGDNGISERYRLYCSEVLGIPPGQYETAAGPAPANGAARKDKLIVITITLPEDTEAQVRVTKHRVSPPPGPAVPATAG
jgi:transcriptional regulator with XRE-family HTH domain